MTVPNQMSREPAEIPEEEASINQLLDLDEEITDINGTLNGPSSDSGRNKEIFDYKDESTGKEYKLKLVHGDFSRSNVDVVAGLDQVPKTEFFYDNFEQEGIVSKEGPVIIQEASDLNYEEAIFRKGWKETLRETVKMQENSIEQSFEQDGRRAIMYDLRPSNIHFFENDSESYDPKFIDVADSQAIKKPDNISQFRKQLATAYEFMINGKDDQKGLIEYAEDNQIDIESGEAAELIAEESRYINEEKFEQGGDLRRGLESSIRTDLPNRFFNYSQ